MEKKSTLTMSLKKIEQRTNAARSRWKGQGGESRQVRISVDIYTRLIALLPSVTERRNFLDKTILNAMDRLENK